MINYQISPHFTIAELVSKTVLQMWGDRATWFIDPRIITCLEFLHARFGTTYLNNWYWGGELDSRGFRSQMDNTGGTMSQHRYGRAADCTFKSVTADEVRKDIIDNWETLYRPLGISTIEDRVAWIHVDLRYIKNQQSIFIVYP